eukprot:2282892-Amphidinium_carterae.1
MFLGTFAAVVVNLWVRPGLRVELCQDIMSSHKESCSSAVRLGSSVLWNAWAILQTWTQSVRKRGGEGSDDAQCSGSDVTSTHNGRLVCQGALVGSCGMGDGEGGILLVLTAGHRCQAWRCP